MANKNINSRIQLKHDTSANWTQAASSFTPLAGEVILYTDINKIKVGDGSTTIGSLPFADMTEGYLYEGAFYKEAAHTNEIPAGTGTMYVDLSTNKIYRYSGSAYVMIGGQDIADMTGATSSTAGTHGLVPAPAAGKQNAYLRGDGTWVDISSIPVISQTSGTIAAGSTTPVTVNYSGTFVNAYVKDADGNSVIADIQVNSSNVVFAVGTASTSSLTCIVMATSASVADANEEEF